MAPAVGASHGNSIASYPQEGSAVLLLEDKRSGSGTIRRTTQLSRTNITSEGHATIWSSSVARPKGSTTVRAMRRPTQDTM
eukprot:7834237-Pyramimonas_sp.AAC.1